MSNANYACVAMKMVHGDVADNINFYNAVYQIAELKQVLFRQNCQYLLMVQLVIRY